MGAGIEQGALNALDDTERVLLAQLYLAAGSWREALDVCANLENGAAAARGLRLCEARARFGMGDREAALALVAKLRRERPDDVVCAYYEAQLLIQSGQVDAALSTLRELVGRAPDFPGALQALAHLTFPGPPYREVLRRLHAELRPEVYLEVGVEHGTSLQLAVHSRVVLGVDPVPRPLPRELTPAARLFHMTSDAFFESHSRAELLGQARVELAFIDGMHRFEYALRDFHNAERWCAPGATLVLHDCLPVLDVAALRDRRTSFWVGDTWKALEFLLLHRRDLFVAVVPTYPSGLVVVQTGHPQAAHDDAQLQAFCADYEAKPYPYAGSWPAHYPVIENSESGLSGLARRLAEGRARARAEAPAR